MGKTLLLIRGIYDTIDLFVEACAGAFAQLGCVCHILDVREGSRMTEKLKKLLLEERIDAVLTFNNIGYNLSLSGRRSVWEDEGILYLNILMDHPFHYDYPLEHAPETSVVFCTDRNHAAYLHRFYPRLKRVDFIPHAGMEADISQPAPAGACHLCRWGAAFHPAMGDRPIDVLYAGSLSKYVAAGLVPDLGGIAEFDAFKLTREVLSELMHHPERTTESAIEDYLRSIGKHYTDSELRHWITELRFLDSFATSFYREQSVQLLVENGIQVTVFGSGWEQCDWAKHPNLIWGGKVPAPQILELMNHSKLVLNTMTWYKSGIHDRIINGMLAKAVVVTDTSDYLEEEFLGQEEECLVPFRLPLISRLPEIVGDLLRDEERMEKIAENGYRYAKARHTWVQRAEYILTNYLT